MKYILKLAFFIMVAIILSIILISIIPLIKSDFSKQNTSENLSINCNPTSSKICKNGKCNLIIYNHVENVYEDGECKKIWNAKSLKNSSVKCSIKKDGLHEAECLDWNYTSISIRTSINDETEANKDIPIKYFEENEEGIKEEKMEKRKNIKFKNKNEYKDILLDYRLGDEIHIGENSTFILLDTPDTDIMDDSFVDIANPTTNYDNNDLDALEVGDGTSNNMVPILRFSLSSLPLNAIIESSYLTLYQYQNTLDSGESLFVYANFFDHPNTWTEETITWNNKPSFNSSSNERKTINFGDSSQYRVWNVTQIINWSVGNGNVSFYMKTDSLGMDSIDIVSFRDKEYTTPSERPFLNITYYTPEINIVYPINNTYTSNKNLSVNFTFFSSYTPTCRWTNDSGITNTTITCGNNVSGQDWKEGLTTVIIYINDSSGFSDSDLISFNVDTAFPTIIFNNPTNGTVYTSQSMTFNVTLDDNIGVGTCLYSLDNANNITMTKLVNNFTHTNSSMSEGDHDVSFSCNDTVGNLNSSIVSFTISLQPPVISLNYPSNNKYFNYSNNIYFNFTSTDSNGLGTCELWGNWTGIWHKNYTWVSPQSGVQNFTKLNISDGKYKWNVWCNDTQNSGIFNNTNRTFTVDTVFPLISNIQISTTIGSQTATLGFNSTDINLDSCWYSVRNSTGEIDPSTIENQSVSCNSQGNSFTVSDYATYNLTIYSNDSANNLNFTTESFTTAASGDGGSVGSGGSGSEPIVIIIESPKNITWTMKTKQEGDTYELEMAVFTSKEKQIVFKNNGIEEINISLNCVGNLCDFLTLDESNFTLPIATDVDTVVKVSIVIPKEATEQIYSATIVGEDQHKNKNLIYIKARIGGLGYIGVIADKIFDIKNIFGIAIPYALIWVFVWSFLSILSYFIGFKFIRGGKAASFIFGMIFGLIFLIFI